jgi:hypothetical protein
LHVVVALSAKQQQAIEAAIQNSDALKSAGKGKQVNYRYNKVGLSGQGQNKYLVYLLGSRFCGSGG